MIVGHLLLGGLVLVVEGPSDQIVFDYLVRKLGRSEVLVVGVSGDKPVGNAVRRLRGAFGKRVVGIQDQDCGREYREGIHVLKRRCLEAYYSREVPKKQKIEAASNVIRGLDGLAFDDEPSLLLEVGEALGLAGSETIGS